MSAPSAARHDASGKGKATTVVLVLALSGIVVALMQTLVIPLVPELPELLHASAANAAWVVTATLLAAAVATPTAGRLGDMYGKRRVLLASLLLLVAGSVVAGLSDSLVPMVIGRALQGLSSGVIALGISVMRDELPAERLSSGTALMSASLGIGGALGLPLAAFLAQQADWHILFWASAGLGVLAFVLVLLLVPESSVRSGGRFDLLGAVGLSAALVCLLLGISKGSGWGWGSGLTLGLFGAAVLLFLLWGGWEMRIREPLVDLRSTARSQVLLTNAASVIFGFAMFAVSLVIPQLVQIPEAAGYGMGGTILVAGLVMAPNGLVMMAMAPLSGRLSNSRGPKVTLMLGAGVVAVGYGLGLVLMSTIWQLVVFSCVIGAGIGLAYGAMPLLIMGSVPRSETAAANSFNTLVRSLGTSTASAVAGLLLAKMTTTVGPATVPSQDAFRVIMVIGAAAAIIALAIAAFLRGKPRARGADVPDRRAPLTVTGHTATTLHPLAGIALTLTDRAGTQVTVTESGDGGRFELTVKAPGTYTLIASGQGYRPHAETVIVGAVPADPLPVTMEPVSSVHGAVHKRQGGAPAPGATVTALRSSGDVITSTMSDQDGRYRLAGIDEAEITVVASAPSATPATVVVALEPRGHDHTVDIELGEKAGYFPRTEQRPAGVNGRDVVSKRR